MKKQSDSSRKKYIITFVFLFSILILYFYLVFTWKPNINLESQRANAAIIRKDIAYYINKDPNEDPNNLTEEDLTQVTFLDLFIKELSDIEELSNLTNLEELALRYVKYPKQKIPKWMKVLAKYGFIDLDKKYSIDLSPLKNLHKLKRLYFVTSQIYDIEPLEGLTNLELLYLHGCDVSDLKPVSKLRKLKELKIAFTPISNLEPISKLENLEVLILENIAVSDIKPLNKLGNLKQLYIDNCKNITKEQVESLQKALPKMKINSNGIDYAQKSR